MTLDQAAMILRRKPQTTAEHMTGVVALKTLAGAGIDQATVEMEILRPLSWAELAAFNGPQD